jgi:hypothetical protein
MFSCPKIAGGGRYHNFSKLLEIKGYEVFRVDRGASDLSNSACLARCALRPADSSDIVTGMKFHKI